MDELIERFLKYIYRKNTQSEKTIESYKNDLNQFKEYLTSQSIDSFEFDYSKKGILIVTFCVHTIYGDIKEERAVNY